MEQILTKKDVKLLTVDEINSKIEKSFYYDE